MRSLRHSIKPRLPRRSSNDSFTNIILHPSWLNSIRGEEESKKIPSDQRCESGIARSSGNASAGEAR